MTCTDCGLPVEAIVRAADDTEVVVGSTPHGDGDWMRVNARGTPEHGKYVRLSGDPLAAARGEGVLLYAEHTREACRRG